MPAFRNLSGQRFGRLTALCRGPNAASEKLAWVCECECGTRCVKTAGQESFEAFWRDMGPTYQSGLSIDRTSNDGNSAEQAQRGPTRYASRRDVVVCRGETFSNPTD